MRYTTYTQTLNCSELSKMSQENSETWRNIKLYISVSCISCSMSTVALRITLWANKQNMFMHDLTHSLGPCQKAAGIEI